MKYPHTPYLHFSPSAPKKDVRESGKFNLADFLDKPLVITEKRDGSNLVMLHDKIAARNGYDATGISFDYAKAIHAGLKDSIPEGCHIYGEWCYAKHSIHYTGANALKSYFQIFGIYIESSDTWKSWDAVERYAKQTRGATVPVLAQFNPCSRLGPIENAIKIESENCVRNGGEGIVVRNADPFSSDQFKHNVAKYVRANHVQTDEHWSQQPLIRNELIR